MLSIGHLKRHFPCDRTLRHFTRRQELIGDLSGSRVLGTRKTKDTNVLLVLYLVNFPLP